MTLACGDESLPLEKGSHLDSSPCSHLGPILYYSPRLMDANPPPKGEFHSKKTNFAKVFYLWIKGITHGISHPWRRSLESPECERRSLRATNLHHDLITPLASHLKPFSSCHTYAQSNSGFLAVNQVFCHHLYLMITVFVDFSSTPLFLFLWGGFARLNGRNKHESPSRLEWWISRITLQCYSNLALWPSSISPRIWLRR